MVRKYSGRNCKMEKKTIYRGYWTWEFDKEEAWLNEMAMSGWLLDGVGFFCYHFVKCEPGEYTIRMEMTNITKEYKEFLSEMNIEYVGHCFQWHYYRKKTVDGDFAIFSDNQSKIDYLKKIANQLGWTGAINILIGLANSFNPVLRMGWLNLLVASLLMYGLGRIHGKIEQLEKDKLLVE